MAERLGHIDNDNGLLDSIDTIINSNRESRRNSNISNLRKDNLLINEIREMEVQPIRWDIFIRMLVLLGIVILDQLIEGNSIIKSIIGIERYTKIIQMRYYLLDYIFWFYRLVCIFI